MTLIVTGLDFFAQEIECDGKSYQVHSVGVGNEFRRSDRLKSLLRDLIFNHDLDVELLNKIGFSDQDADELGLRVEDLEAKEIPPRSEWYD